MDGKFFSSGGGLGCGFGWVVRLKGLDGWDAGCSYETCVL